MMTNEGDCRVVVVGAGAGGTLVATHLVTALSSRFRVELVDPAPTTGRGQAYSTHDERHLLNVPASGMTAFPRDPEHFLRWLRNHHDPKFQPHEFAPRAVFSVVAGMAPLGGSKAQREVVEDTLVFALAMADRNAEAAAVLDERLSRRSSPLDARRRAAVVAGVPAGR